MHETEYFCKRDDFSGKLTAEILAEVFRDSPNLLFVCEADTMNLLWVSHSISKLIGISQEECFGLNGDLFKTYIAADDMAALRDAVRRLRTKGEKQSVMFEMKDVEGKCYLVAGCLKMWKETADGKRNLILGSGMHVDENFLTDGHLSKMQQELRHRKLVEKKDKLTKREVEVMILVAKNYTDEQIAVELFISRQTVRTHHKTINLKTQVSNALGLLKYAINYGYCRLEEVLE